MVLGPTPPTFNQFITVEVGTPHRVAISSTLPVDDVPELLLGIEEEDKEEAEEDEAAAGGEINPDDDDDEPLLLVPLLPLGAGIAMPANFRNRSLNSGHSAVFKSLIEGGIMANRIRRCFNPSWKSS